MVTLHAYPAGSPAIRPLLVGPDPAGTGAEEVDTFLVHDRGWSLATVFDDHAARFPHAPALAHADVVRSWSTYAERAHRLAAGLRGLGVGPGSRVALLLHNGPEYLETVYALSVLRAVHVNSNYRYTAPELASLWRSMLVEAVVVDERLAGTARDAARHLPGARLVVVGRGDGTGEGPATRYESLLAASAPAGHDGAPDGTEHLLICTGGTTGHPKGVVWQATDLFCALRPRAFGSRAATVPDRLDLVALRQAVAQPGLRGMPLAPLMHGTGLVNALAVLMDAGCVVTDDPPRFDPARALDVMARHRVQTVALVGDAFARPLLAALDAEPGRWDLSALQRVISAGVMWSDATKAGLLRHVPGLEMADSLGASEAMGMARAIAGPAGIPPTGLFELAVTSLLVDDTGRPVPLEPGAAGRLAMTGHIPLGYTAEGGGVDGGRGVFFERDGVRHVAPGDLVEVVSGRTVRLLGRGSTCINTGGEKVFPEEVEEALKRFPGVVDAAVVGIPHERYGSAVAAVVASDSPVEVGELVGSLAAELAGYKVPRTVRMVPAVPRAANGKLDLPAIRALLDTSSA